jgi:hypothetical protein
MSTLPCTVCGGARLKPESLAVTVAGRSLGEVVEMPVDRALDFFDAAWPTRRTLPAGDRRPDPQGGHGAARFLVDVGLEYLTLGRSAETLSGGEAQRIRLATQIGSRLVGVLYILDEPSIGLHQRDNRGCSRRSSSCATSATRCSWWSTTRRRSARPTTSSTWARAPGGTAGGGRRRARSRTCWRRRLADRRVPARRAARSRPAERAAAAGPRAGDRGRARAQPADVTSRIPLGCFVA